MTHPANRQPGLKKVYVARTVETTQKPFEGFLKQLAKHLGGTAVINNIGSTHLTFLESRGVKDKFISYGYSPNELKGFVKSLEQRLVKNGHHKNPLRVRPEAGHELDWIRKGKLAVMIAKSEQLLDSRGLIEQHLLNQLGVLPELTNFTPHITVGMVHRWAFTEELAADPYQALPPDLQVPGRITLNGLEVFLEKIHGGQSSPRLSEAAHIERQMADHVDPIA